MFQNNNIVVGIPGNYTGLQSRPDTLVPVVIIHIIIIVGIIGNSFIIAIVTMINSMKTTTNILLVNVAIADIVLLVFTSIHMILARTIPLNNDFLCKIIEPNTLSNVALLATSATLTILSIERYNALVKPMDISRRLTLENVQFVIIGIWVASTLMNLPLFIYMDFDPLMKICSPKASLLVVMGVIVLTMTIIPFLIIALCYTKIILGLYFSKTICSTGHSSPEFIEEELASKKKLVKLLIAITVIFFIAFVPYGVLQISRFGLTGAKKRNPAIIVNLAKTVVYLIPIHSSINPFLYTLQSNNYRQGFKKLIKKFVCVRKHNGNRGSYTHGSIMTPSSSRQLEAEV